MQAVSVTAVTASGYPRPMACGLSFSIEENAMKRTVTHFLTGVVLMGLGWVAGAAQTTRGDLEIRVQAPTGKTTVECVRGCKVIGARDIENPRASQTSSYWFSCGAPDGCQGRIVGFVQPEGR
jgi:hypothetical protein